MEALIYSSGISHRDPFLGYYHFFHAHALKYSADLGESDRLKALQKSVKFIQERSTRIDYTNHKQNYLKRNRLNSMILHEAEKCNLV